MKPVISVIVPVYNVESYLKECVESILNQTFSNFELILVDDGSTDSSGSICDDYQKKDNRIFVIHKKNGGLSSARNAGLDYVFQKNVGEYISFIDSDDFVHRDFLRELLKAMHGCDMSLCYFSSFIDSNNVKIPNIKIIERDGYWKLINSNNSFTICAWNKLYKRDIFENIRYPEGRIFEDSYIIHDILLKCNKISVVEKFLYYYRIRENSIVHSFDDTKGTIDSLECKLNRMNLYYKINDKKMFPTVFDDCFDYLVYSYKKAKSSKNMVFLESVSSVFKKAKTVYKSKKFKSFHKNRIGYWLFFSYPNLYILISSIKARLKK